MKFQKWDLGFRKKGEIVKVTLSGNAANVKLMDSLNFQKYRRGNKHKFYGGQAVRSPVHIPIPHSGIWHVIIDFGGFAGRAQTSVNVLPVPQRLPRINEAPLSSVPTLVRNVPPGIEPDDDTSTLDYDVFISHASEDKDEVVRPLAVALRDGGLKVWYDEFELRIGDSLRRKIDAGLANSRFGIVVLSRSFFKKGWTNYELDGLVTRSVTGEQVLLPIWHDITKKEVIDYSPSLADKIARSTSIRTVEEIALEIIDLIHDA